MDGENKENPFKMDDLVGKSPYFGSTPKKNYHEFEWLPFKFHHACCFFYMKDPINNDHVKARSMTLSSVPKEQTTRLVMKSFEPCQTFARIRRILVWAVGTACLQWVMVSNA